MKTSLILLFSLVLGTAWAGNEVGGNGDAVTAWFNANGHRLCEAYRGAELPEFTARECEAALATQIVLVGERNLAQITNQFGEVKDLKVVFDRDTPLILLNQKLWTARFQSRQPEYRMVLHAYVLAAGKQDRDYLLSGRIRLPQLEKPRPFTASFGLGSPRATEDGGFVGIDGNKQLVRVDRAGKIVWRAFLQVPSPAIVTLTTDGGYLVAGNAPEATYARHMHVNELEKLDGDRQSQWVRELDARAAAKSYYAIWEDADGRILSLSNDGLERRDSNGEIDLTLRVGLKHATYLHRAIATHDGGQLAVGERWSEAASGYVLWFWKLSAGGATEWQRETSIAGESHAVAEAADGYWVAGPRVVKLSAAGEVTWQSAPLTKGPATAAAVLPDGSVVVGVEGALLRYGADGASLPERFQDVRGLFEIQTATDGGLVLFGGWLFKKIAAY